MSRLSAASARDIARAKDPAFAVETILTEVAKAAEAGQYKYTTREYGFGSKTYCNERDYPLLCKAILKELRELGYQCQVNAEERQFVDLWLEVSWAEVKK